MGLDVHGIRFLLEARARGVSFERVAMIGRQSLHVDRDTLGALLNTYGPATPDTQVRRLMTENGGFCDPLLRLLGAVEVCSVDLSAYEGATLLHDMNRPIPEDWRQRFSVVLDSGSLEHVFDFPRAIANCMQMVDVGGHFLGLTPGNNAMGHGFYQFSPELYFRVFSGTNGFATRRMIAYQDCWPFDQWYEVRDPEHIGKRVTLVNRYPTFLLVEAQKVAETELFTSIPQQSDYVSLWQQAARGENWKTWEKQPRPASWRERVISMVRGSVVALVPRSLKQRYHVWRTGGNPFDPTFFSAVDAPREGQ